MWVVAYFESGVHAEIAGIFPDEETYSNCVEALEEQAKKNNMILTESCELSYEEMLDKL